MFFILIYISDNKIIVKLFFPSIGQKKGKKLPFQPNDVFPGDPQRPLDSKRQDPLVPKPPIDRFLIDPKVFR
jgi:hypothetical protein